MARHYSRLLAVASLVIALLVPTACHNNRPQPFLDKEEVTQLLADIRLAETQLYSHRETRTDIADPVMQDRSVDAYVPIFKKYGINYQQYQNLLTYYMNRPVELEEIMQDAAALLKARAEEAKNPSNGAEAAGK